MTGPDYVTGYLGRQYEPLKTVTRSKTPPPHTVLDGWGIRQTRTRDTHQPDYKVAHYRLFI